MVKHIFLLLSMLLVLVACKQDKVVPQASPMTSPATSEGDPSHMELPMNEQYVGTEACKACHEKEFESWHGSHHDMAMKKPTPETVRGDFNDITVTIKGKTTRFYTAEDGKYFIEDHLADSTKKAYEVIYTFGWEPLQQYLVEADGGRLQVYKLCWDTEQHKWFHIYGELRIADHDWLHWSKGGMNWNTMCSDCHSTHVQKNYDSEKDIFDTSYEIINVSCEACHGPAHKHLEWAKNKTLPDKDDHYILKTFRNLDNKKFVDECARCHSRRGQITNLYDHSGEFSDHYQLSELRNMLYHADGQILDEVYVFGSFAQSKMYQNHVQCSDCHDSHSTKLKLPEQQLCLQCHIPEKYDSPSHHHHKENSEASKCVNCHMTGATYMQNDFRRDHSFRIPRPDQSAKYGTPNACNECHKDQSAQWASEQVNKWYGEKRAYHFSDDLIPLQLNIEAPEEHLYKLITGKLPEVPEIVKATAWSLAANYMTPRVQQEIPSAIKDPSPYVRRYVINAIGALPPNEQMPFLLTLMQDKVRVVRIRAIEYIQQIKAEIPVPTANQAAYEKAYQEYEHELYLNSDFQTGRTNLAFKHYLDQDFDGAIREYNKALEIDPLFYQAGMNLAQLYYQLGRKANAEEEFKRVIKTSPNYGDANYFLAMLIAEDSNRMGEAFELFKKAADMTGRPRYAYNALLTLLQMKQVAEAIKYGNKQLQRYPSDPNLIYGLYIALMQYNDKEEARRLLQNKLQEYPEIAPQIQRLLNGS